MWYKENKQFLPRENIEAGNLTNNVHVFLVSIQQLELEAKAQTCFSCDSVRLFFDISSEQCLALKSAFFKVSNNKNK